MKDFATPSLNSCESPTGTCDQDGDANSDDEGATAAEVVRLSLRRRWETRYDNILKGENVVYVCFHCLSSRPWVNFRRLSLNFRWAPFALIIWNPKSVRVKLAWKMSNFPLASVAVSIRFVACLKL